MVGSSFIAHASRLVLFVLGIAGICLSPAQAQTPTAEQIEIFQSLSSEQQQAILEAMGQGGQRSRGDSVQDSVKRSSDQASRNSRRPAGSGTLDNLAGPPRFKPQDTLLLSLKVRDFEGEGEIAVPAAATSGAAPAAPVASTPPNPIQRSEAELARLAELRTNILRRNPFHLDKWGILTIPELGPIPLAGLTAEEARQRLAAEPLLADFVVRLTYLPVKPVGPQALKPFGHDLFDAPADTFAPVTDIPVPAGYVIGPGDTLEVQLIGRVKGRYSLVVRRDGRINFPELGPIPVGGMQFDEARAFIEQRVSEQLIGTQASVQMGELRSIQVFVVGDAKQPGAYTLSGLSTITNALFVSGGPTEIGSLRNIELKRGGQTVAEFDLYDLLLRGDTSSDARLVSGDVILIPPVGRVVGISGEVRRPALYELKGESTVAQLIALAGGLKTEADGALATIERIGGGDQQRRILKVDLNTSANTALQDGDVLHVPTIRPTVDDAVELNGHVFRPGSYPYRPGMRITDVIASLEELRPMADQHYVLVRREVPPTRRVEYYSADLARALENPSGAANIELAPRDRIFVFDLETGRDRLLEPLMREVRLQSTRDAPSAEVTVGGRVKAPGVYPLERGMRVADLIRAGGSLDEAAYGGKAELTRNALNGGEARQTELIEIDLAKAIAGDPAENILLQPFDYLVIKELPLWGAQEYVQVDGEVRFPGRYPIQRGETLRSVVERAGGVTDFAFVRGAVFTRESLKERERQQIDELVRRMQTDLAQVSLMAAQEARGDAAQALAVGQQLLENLRNAQPVGRLVIDLDKALTASANSSSDIMLKDGDRLIVPRITQEVTVIGEVQSPTSHLYSAGLGRNDYIRLSGGTTPRADKGRIYVVRADGSVGGTGNRWFGADEIQPGDTIVVPLDADRVRMLPVWTAVTTIIYNLAVAVAAVNSF
jgi:polysaccharide export outer membrane protein